ncbi:formate dehydrogenase subunit delta [Massilia forsythiae]|uniref:Formate dehydrogenase subunit delta n=1 Tax=Massilia forsythiae TaxID=2728020 RepID=A0A7Z2ZSC3_9BURK|nr:formate dehydrogenase subunit delta [Massilia forsythiae]QJE00055.1 formate dehydrogenase subunit delta [Massilia forsythiae]
MNIAHLVTMANQIGSFFASFPDREEAQAGIAQHLQRYWAPRMRVRLYDHVDDAHGDGLDPIVLEAIAAHRQRQDAVAEGTSVPKDEDTGGDAG